MKQKFCLCITIALLLALFTSCSQKKEGPDTQKGAAGEEGAGGIDLPNEPENGKADFPSGGIYIQYAVNSSAAGKISGTVLQNVQDQESEEVAAAANLGYRFVRWSDGQEEPVRKGDAASENQVITAIFDYDQLEMPILSIVTETGKDVQSKTEYIKATLTILGAGKEYNLDSQEMQIRGRGNNTWTYEKKSYKMKLAEKQSLLGLGQGKAKKWVLLANHCDQSHLRNYVTLHLAASMPSLAWSPDCTPVEVYLNGEYRGVYLLAEDVDVNKNKVAVSEEVTGAGYDIGFLLEMTGNAKDVIFEAGGKLAFGPLWDFDLALGNGNQGVETYDSLYAAYAGGTQSNPWFYTAMNHLWFRRRVVERWDEIAGLRGGLSAMVTETAQKYYQSFCRNFDKWKIFGQSLNRETQQITSLSSYEEHYRFLADWIEKRLEWLEDCYQEESFLAGWTGYNTRPGEGRQAGERLGNEEAASLFGGYARLAVMANSVEATMEGFGNEEVRNLFDNNVQTKYCAAIGNGQDLATVDITFSLSEGASLSGYAFCTANDTSQYPERNPESWVLFAKASDGNWVELDTCDKTALGLDAADYACYGRFCADMAENADMEENADMPANADMAENTDRPVYTDYRLTIIHRGILQLSDIVLFGDILP